MANLPFQWSMKLKQYGPQLKAPLRGIWARGPAGDHMNDRGSDASFSSWLVGSQGGTQRSQSLCAGILL